MLLVVEQVLNGLQFGLMLFLLAAGLTLVFGIMDIVNLAHGSLYMMGAYFAATFVGVDRQFRARRAAGAAARRCCSAWSLEVVALRHALRPRPSRPGAGDLRADPVLQRAGAADLGPGRPVRCRCRAWLTVPVADPARRALSGLPPRDHRGRRCWSRCCSMCW